MVCGQCPPYWLFMRSRANHPNKPVQEATLNINHYEPCPYCDGGDDRLRAIEYILAPGQRMMVKSVNYPEGKLYTGKEYQEYKK
jgi:hypothetical protein